jgi:hypothetical protein
VVVVTAGSCPKLQTISQLEEPVESCSRLEPLICAVGTQIARNLLLVISLLKEELRLLSTSRNLAPKTFQLVQELGRAGLGQ